MGCANYGHAATEKSRYRAGSQNLQNLLEEDNCQVLKSTSHT